MFIWGTDVRSCLILFLTLGSQGYIHPQGFDASTLNSSDEQNFPKKYANFCSSLIHQTLKNTILFQLLCEIYSYLEGVVGNIQNSQVPSKVKMQDLNLELCGFKTPPFCSLSTTVSCCGAGRGPALLSEHSLTKCNMSFTLQVFLWVKSLLLSLAVT